MPLWKNIFLILTLAPQLPVCICYTDFHKNPPKAMVLTDRQMDGRTDGRRVHLQYVSSPV